ncbi:MAG TPA: ribosomal protein S18-alanine N-acetyltransferase [Cellvibrionaceae bacterium]
MANNTIAMKVPHLSARDFSGEVQTIDGLHLSLQPLTDGHIDAVSVIERKAHTHPWTPSLFNDCLKGRQHCVLAFAHAQLAGYFVLTCTAGDAELLNITVAPGFQGQGVGKCLLSHMQRLLQPHADTLYLEVRASNVRAIALYDSLGFVEVGIRPNYYPAAQGREDAIIYALTLDDLSIFNTENTDDFIAR